MFGIGGCKGNQRFAVDGGWQDNAFVVVDMLAKQVYAPRGAGDVNRWATELLLKSLGNSLCLDRHLVFCYDKAAVNDNGNDNGILSRFAPLRLKGGLERKGEALIFSD